MSVTLDGGEYLWQRDERFWPRCAPVLFPIVGNIRADQARSAAGPVSLKRHGIARNYEHAVLSKGQSTVTFELNADEGMLERYPSPFRLRMTYALSDDVRTISTPDSKIRVLIVPTNEEYMIALDVAELLG